MAYLVSDVIALARASINDPLSKRFSPSDAVAIYNRTLNRLYVERPDIFVSTAAGNSLATSPGDKAGPTAVPYEDQFAQLHADMIVAEMETVPDDEISNARQQLFDARSRR